MNEDRISRHDAERILREAASGPRPGQDPLTAFLAAAAGPARDDELAGEEAAVTAFRAARGAARTRRRLRIAQVLTVKAAVALGLTATAAGGVALAAGTGALPGPLGDRQPAVERTSSNPATGGQLTTSRHPGGAGGPGGTPGTGEPAPSS